VVGDVTVDGDGVEGEFLALDEFLHAHHRHMTQAWQHVAQLVGFVHAVGVGGARARDRLENDREADALRRFPALLDAGRGEMARRADARGIEHLLHALLVAEGERLRRAETRHAERLAQLRGQHHARLPQAFDAIELASLEPRAQLLRHLLLVP
jgi:hypothetical protein